MEAFFIKPAKVSPAVAAGLSLFQRLDSTLTMVVKAAFDEASGVIPSALLLAEGDEVRYILLLLLPILSMVFKEKSERT